MMSKKRDMRSPDHLPKKREDGRARHPSWLPRQRRGITPQMIGRYPDYDVLDAVDTWDEVTRKVVLARLGVGGPLRFFSETEEPTLRAFCDTVTAQDVDPRVPVAEMVDAKYADGKLDGYRYEDMPADPETWHAVLAALEETANARYGRAFSQLEADAREEICQAFPQGELNGGEWAKVNVKRPWSGVLRAG